MDRLALKIVVIILTVALVWLIKYTIKEFNKWNNL